LDRLTRIFLIVCLAAFVSSFIVQTAFQFPAPGGRCGAATPPTINATSLWFFASRRLNAAEPQARGRIGRRGSGFIKSGFIRRLE
jgi:hypothetical protein